MVYEHDESMMRVTLKMLVDAIKNHFDANVMVSEAETEFTKRSRHFIKWWFDLIKNTLLVVALRVFAEKSHLWYVYVLYVFSNSLLVIYCASYFQGRYYIPTLHVKESLLLILTFGITLFGVLAAFILVGVGTSVVIDALSQVQAH
jgi:hypothetical protein